MRSKQLSLSKLTLMGDSLMNLYASAVPGEQFHEKYQKNKDIFRLVTKSDIQTERKLNGYFTDLAQRIENMVVWNKYENRAASELLPLGLGDEKAILASLFSETLIHALVAGGQFTQDEFNIDIGWSATDQPAVKFLKKYVFQLAGQLNKTTLDRLNESLRMSISLGEARAEAVARMAQVIENPTRSAVIAHTESVRAFSEGRLEVGRQVGATTKEWDATGGACPICDALDHEVVGIDEDFSSGDAAPPAHPNCRCIVVLHMENE